MAKNTVKVEELPEIPFSAQRFPAGAVHSHNDLNQPAVTGVRKKFVNINNNSIRIDFEGGGYMVMGFVGVDTSGNKMFGIIINDGTNDRYFAGIQKGGF